LTRLVQEQLEQEGERDAANHAARDGHHE